MPDVMLSIDAAYNSDIPPGIPTGFIDFDSKIGRWQSGMLIIIAGRPGLGKSAILKTHIEAALDANIPAGIISIEMSNNDVIKRFLSGMSGVPFTDIQTGRRSYQFNSICEAARRLYDKPIYFATGIKHKISSVIQEIKRMKRRYNVGIVTIDYLQLISTDSKSKNREAEVSEISRRLKVLAEELRIPIICVAQLNRDCERRENKRPTLADLRESGAIEQDADMVVFLYRQEYYQRGMNSGIAELIIAKHRNGRTGVLEVTWLPEIMTFRDLVRTEGV